ncbi:lipoprotein 17-related variable surface protein [Mycoplasmopsis gallinacea]|uniref:ECM-binding protein homolog n=1 Tax=Mycoplasmopsis gallinacea TaxID=29556 RepID=A0A449A2B2_9BACT|nr:lipoprotein 17-related variable surface protein [Mycoplasmopsis gallinacea]VEU58398.1 ECM-binding protein homolog [Mycoplasmopsis gallinacea]
MKNRKKIKKIVLAVSATSASLPFVFLPISQTNTTGSSQEIDSKYMSYSQYNKVQDDGIYTNYSTVEGMFFEGWAIGNKKQPIYIGTNPKYSKDESGYNKSKYYINERNNWYRLYDYNANKEKWDRYRDNYNPAWDLLNPSLILNDSTINTRYNWQKNDNKDSSFFNGDGWDSVNDTKSFRVGFNVDKLRSDDRKFLVGLWISEDLILTGNIKAIVSTRNTNNPFQEAIANPSNVRTYNISVDEKYDVNDVKDKTNSATWYGKEEYKYRINPWISKSYDYTGVFKEGDNHSGFKFYSSNKNNEYAEFSRYYVDGEDKYTTGKTWLNSMHYGSFYKSFPKEINQNITNQYGILWGGVANDYFRKRTIANMIIHDEPSLDGDWKYAPVAYAGNEYKLGLFQKQYKDNNNYIYNSLNNNAGSLLILEIKSEDKSTAGFTPSLQLEFTVKRNPNTIDNNGVRSGNNANPLSRDSSSKKTYIGFGQFKYEQSKWANRQFGSFMKMADRQAYQNIKFNTTEKLVKSEYLLDNDKLPNTTLSLIEDNNGSERLIHSVNKSKYNEVINQDKILAEYKTKNNVDSLTQYSNINNLRLKTSFANSEDNKKWKIISENSYSTQNPNIFSFNTTDGDGYLNFNEISYDLTDYEKLKRFANDRTKNKWLTIKQINYLLSQIEQNENFNKATYSFNDPKWFDYFKEQISNLNNLQGQAEAKRAELRNLILSTTDKTEWNSEISNRVLFAFSDPREAKSPAWNLLEREGYWNWQASSLQRKYNIQSELNSNSEAIDRNDDSKVILQTTTEIEKFIADVNNVINKIKETGKSNLESEFINTLNNQSITNSTWSKYNYNQGTKFIINAINSVVANRNTPYDLTTFTPTTNQQYKNDKTSILNKIQNLSTLYDAIQNIQTKIQDLKNDKLVYGKTSNKPAINDDWYNNFVEKLQNANNIQSDSSYAFSSQNNLDTFRTNNANKLKTNWTDKILELNGNKNQFTNDINSFNYLDSSAKQSFIQRKPAEKNFVYSEINYQLTDNRNTINNQLTSLINEAFTQAKIKAKEKINSFAYVSQTLKTTASNNIDSAELYKNTTNNAQDSWVYFGNDQNLKTIVDELEKQNNYHKQLIDYLESSSLNGKNNVLTQKQKEAFKNDILSKNFADQNEVNEYKNSINNVNDATKNLKTYVTNLNTNTDKYNFASPDKKRNFDAYKEIADSLVNNVRSIINSTHISKLQENLTNAYGALDGDIFINKVKELNYLTTNLQNLIINQIKAADPRQRKAIYEKAKKLNDDFGKTDLTSINTYNSAKSTPDYTNGSKARKSAFDTALTNLNAKLNTSKNKLEQPTQIPTNYTNFIENYISQYDQLKSAIATAYNNIDGNEITAEKARLNAIDLTFDYPSKEAVLPSEIRDSSITNNLPNNSKANVVTSNIAKTDSNGTVSLNYQLVSTDPKFSYLPADEKIKSDSKSANITGFLTSSQKAFNDKKASLIEAINQAKNNNKITESQKQKLIDAVNKATSLDELNKQEAKDNEIFKLTSTYEHLNPKQNQELFEKIQNATSIQDAQTIFAKQENVNLNNSMKKLKYLASEYTNKKSNVDYKSATNQSQFDAIFNSANELISSTTNNGTTNPSLNTLIGNINQSGSLNNSFALLDGIKNKAKNDINGLNYLTKTQKQQYKSEINKISDLQSSENKQNAVNKVLTKAKLNQYNATFDYANKSKITPSQIVDNNVSKVIVYNDSLNSPIITTDQIVIKEIVKNNADGTATVKYVIKDATDQSLTSEVKEATIRDFKTGNQAEKERLNAINSVTVNATPQQKQNQASKLTNPQELQWDIQNSQNAEIVDKTIVGYNDITGKLKVSYRLKSKTSTNIYSDIKYAEIEGFQTEKQRLDALLTQENAILTITNKKVPTEATYGTDFNISFKDSNAHKASFKNSPNITNRSDRDGQIAFDYTLKSDRQDLITIPEEVNQASEVVSTKSSSFTASGLLTEKQRLDQLIDNDQVAKTITYPDSQNVIRSEINKDNFVTQITQDAQAKIVIDSFSNNANNPKAIDIIYHLVSTKDGVNAISKTKTLTLDGFQSDVEREQKTINAYTENDYTFTSDNTKLASYFKDNASQIQISPKTTTNRENETIEIQRVVAYNDVDGTLKVEFVTKSNKNGTLLTSNTKVATISGYKTESQRLDDLLNNLSQNNINVAKDKATTLPSDATTATDYTYSLSETEKATLNIVDAISPNNELGKVTFTAKLVSSKAKNELIYDAENTNLPAITTPETSITKSLEITGLRTQAEQDRLDKEAEVARLNNLAATFYYTDKATTLPSEANKKQITSNITNQDPEATVQIKNITAYDEITGSITFEYTFDSAKSGIYNGVESETKTATLNGFKTEKMRLDQLLTAHKAQLEAKINTLATNAYKDNLASNVINNFVIEDENSNLTDARINVTLKKADDVKGQISYTYNLVSTKTLSNQQDLSTQNSETASGILSGFKTNADVESERLNSTQSYTINYANKATTLASSLKDDAISNWTWNKPDDADYEFIDQKVIAYDDVNGKIKVEFKLKSTKNNLGKEVISDKKVVELTGFLTEKQRLDNLIKAIETSSVITNNEDALTKKPSQLTDNDFTITKPEAWNNENLNIALVINNQDRDDENGTIKVSYQLSTTRTDLVSGYDNVDQNLVSDNAPKVTFNNYLTTTQEEINRLDAINPTYSNLNNELLPSQINTNNSNTAFSINLPNGAEAQVVNLAIDSQNDKDGSLTISYQLQSTKNNLNTLQSAKKTYTFNQANNNQYFTEKQRLDLLAYSPTLSTQTQATKTASEIKARDIEFANVENATVLISDVNIDSINEVTGEVQITYLATSQRANLTDVKSSVKNATLNTLTELQRLNNLVAASQKVFNFAGDKAQNLTTVDEVTLEQLSGYLAQEIDNQKTNILSQNKAKLVIDSIESTNSETGEIVLNWYLESTKNNSNNQVVKTANKQYTFTGFQTANQREQQELNALENIDFTFTYDRNKLASELKTNPSGISIQSTRGDTTAESVKVIAYNDVTGELVLQYVAKSTKNGTNFTSEPKTVTLNGFKTEQQRLDQLADNLSNTSLIFNNDNSTRVNYLPSNSTSTTQNNYVYANSVNDQASLDNITFNANDETGSLTSQITLISDKSRNDLIWSEDNLKYNDYQYSTITSKAKELILTGFRTQNEQNNLDQAAERARLNDLSASFDYTDKANVLPSDSVKNAITSQINQADSQATVKIIQINTKDEINGQITGKYVFVSGKGGIYSNLESDEKEFTITGFKTESQRLNDLLATIEAQASIQNVSADQYKNHLPQEVLNQLILSANNLTNAQIQIVDKNANSTDAAIDYTYRLVSTRGLVNGQNLNDVASTATKNGQLAGFKSLKEAEKERLDAIDINNTDDQFSHTIDYAAKNSQLASSLTQATEQNWNWQVNPDNDHQFVDQQIVGYNDITGELKVSYKLQSKKPGFETVQSETKYAIISGFKTEKQRLDDLVNNTQNQPVTISQNTETLKDGAKAKKASDLETSDFATTLTSAGENQNIKVYLELDTKNADNEHGTILVGYQLESTRNLTGENGLVSENWENKPTEKPLIKSEKSRSQEFSGYVTNDDEEANRIEKLLPLIKLDYPDKANYLPLLNENQVLNENVQVKFKDGRNLIDEQVELKPNSLTIVKRDDEQGLIQVQYTLVSTTRNNIERVLNATAQEDAKQLTGFKTELQRLQALNYDWENQITDKNLVSPSDLQQSDINAINNELDQATNIQITSRNDKTGVISGTYSIYSKRPNLNTIHIDNLAFTINGLQTENQRLDRVIADQNIAKSITYNKNDQNTAKASALVANKAEVIKNLNNSYFVTSVANNEVNKAQIVIDDISANDDTGILTVTYHLTSLKEGLTDQRSSATQTLEIGGFLTNLQDAKNKAKDYIDQLVAESKLTDDQAEELKTEIDNATNNNEITQLKTKADKQVIINDALNNFTNLNQAQKDKLIEDITNSPDINEAQKIKEKYSDLNDKMGELADLVAEYKKKKAEDKYTQATKNTKDAFDAVITKVEELLDETNSTDLGTNIDEFLGTKEDHSDGSIVQKYEALDGEIQKVIKQVEASELLSDDQKTSFKEELNKVSPKDLSYTENNQTKTLDDIKANILEKEQEKQRYINAINTFENLNQQQKDDYINQIKAANSSELETINEEARLLDNEMAKLKEAAKDQEAIQADSKYLEADEAVKNAYETAIIEANKVINGRPTDATENDDFNYNANKEQVTKLIEKLNLAKLNIEKDASKKAIDNLPNLNQNEKNNAKDLIDQATYKTEVETIEAVEKNRNDKKQPYIEQIQAISNLTDAEKTNYINEIKNTNLNLSPDNVVENVADFEAIILKAQKESLIKELEKSVNNDETTRILNPKQLEYFKNEINNATNSKQAHSAFTSALEVADKMANLKAKVAKYTELINDSNNTKYQNADNQELIQNKLKVAKELLNSTTENGLDRDNDNLNNLVANNKNNQSLDYAYDILNGKENALKEKVDNSDLLSDEEKTSLIEQIDNIDKLNNEDEQIAEIAKTIANKEEAKQDAIEQINNLEHLNQNQKDSLINEIKSSSAEQKDNVVNKAKELDKAMEELQNEVQNSEQIHQSNAYQNATDEEKNNYDNALENAKQVLNNQKPNDYASSNLNQNEVLELINKLREIAKTIANKEEAKQDAINQINNLEHLNESQKDSLINEIKTSSAQEKDNIVNKAKELDRAMEELQNEVQDSEQIHQSTAYQNATDEEKNNYDNALENAKQVLNNQKPNDYASSKLNQNEVVELINKLREIKNKQNENINEALDTKELIASLNDLVNLTKTNKWNKFTKEQKDAINNAISNSNNILDNLDKYTNDDLKEQTEINRLLLKTKVNSKIWWLLILTAGTIATMGLIFIILALKRRKVEDED